MATSTRPGCSERRVAGRLHAGGRHVVRLVVNVRRRRRPSVRPRTVSVVVKVDRRRHLHLRLSRPRRAVHASRGESRPRRPREEAAIREPWWPRDVVAIPEPWWPRDVVAVRDARRPRDVVAVQDARRPRRVLDTQDARPQKNGSAVPAAGATVGRRRRRPCLQLSAVSSCSRRGRRSRSTDATATATRPPVAA